MFRFGCLAIVALGCLVATSCPSPTITLTPPSGPSASQMVSSPVFSPTAGIFTTDQTVSISDSTAGATIYYTTDGTVPTTSSPQYTGPIQVKGNGNLTWILAMAALSGMSNSGLGTAGYKISHPISTIAGNGTGGYTGEGIATTVELNNPTGIAIDSSKNLYIADTFNRRVRKIDNTGLISTIAGNGTSGTMVAGPATSSPMQTPVAVALDSPTSPTCLYIADSNANAVYKVRFSDSTISRFAGSPTGLSGFSGNGGDATAALLSYPSGIAVDSTGAVYIADSTNNVVRKVTLGTPNIINAFAGTYYTGTSGQFSGDNGPSSQAQLYQPYGVAVDSSNNVYIADSGNYRVRKVTSGTINTVAGGGNNYISQDGSIATSAGFGQISTVATDASGNFYLGASWLVCKVDASGHIWIMAGGGGSSSSIGDGGPAASAYLSLGYYWNGCGGVAVDSSGGIYICDSGNNRVRKVP